MSTKVLIVGFSEGKAQLFLLFQIGQDYHRLSDGWSF